MPVADTVAAHRTFNGQELETELAPIAVFDAPLEQVAAELYKVRPPMGWKRDGTQGGSALETDGSVRESVQLIRVDDVTHAMVAPK